MSERDELPTHLENVPERPIDPERVLSDDELRSGGLEPVRAYVRTKAGKAAQRQQRYREKLETAGVKQTNVQVPEQHQETIREVARRLRDGEPLDGVIAPEKAAEEPQARPAPSIPPSDTSTPSKSPDALSEADRRLLTVAKGRGVRSRLIRLLAGL